jgi:1-acyl-sn-glycerol-3-phosphate acyltransferase
MFLASAMAISMIFLARFLLELRWGNSIFSWELTLLISLVYTELMCLFTSSYWDNFAGDGPWNIIPTIIIIAGSIVVGLAGFVVTLVVFPFSIVIKRLRYEMVYAEGILFSFVFGFPTDIIGVVAEDGRSRVVFSKHSSFGDMIIFAWAYIFRFWTVISKFLMFFIPLFCTFLCLEGISLRRGKGKKTKGRSGVLAKWKAVRKMKNGYDLSVYPEGTRSEELASFKSGSAKMAHENGFLMTPFAIRWQKPYDGGLWVNPQHPIGEFGEDIDSTQFAKWEELNDFAHNSMEKLLAK